MGNLVGMSVVIFVHVTVYVFMCRHVYMCMNMIFSCMFIRAHVHILHLCTL